MGVCWVVGWGKRGGANGKGGLVDHRKGDQPFRKNSLRKLQKELGWEKNGGGTMSPRNPGKKKEERKGERRNNPKSAWAQNDITAGGHANPEGRESRARLKKAGSPRIGNPGRRRKK